MSSEHKMAVDRVSKNVAEVQVSLGRAENRNTTEVLLYIEGYFGHWYGWALLAGKPVVHA